MRTALVTGGAGFIGSHLVDALLARGDAVRVLDDFSTGKPENLAGSRDAIEIYEGDLRDQSILEKAVRGVEVVFHQAAFVSVPQSLEEPSACLDCNVRGTQVLLETCRQASVKRAVLASSAAVYGNNPDLPLSEGAEVDPLSPYAASKYINEIYGDLYSSQLGLEVVALRYFNVYGPRQNPASDYAAVIPIFLRQLLADQQPVIFGDGGQSRDFIFVADVVRANLLAADTRGVGGQAFNICSGKEASLLELISVLESVFGREIQPRFDTPRPGDIYRSLGDPSLAERALGFQAVVDLMVGLTETAAWLKGSSHE